MSTALVWFRRDLRLADNPALRHALDHHDAVVPVFIHAPEEEAPWQPGAASNWWRHRSLIALKGALETIGGTLLIRHGESLAELRSLIKATKANAVYWNRLYEPAIIARDRAVKEALTGDGLDAHSFNAALMVEPWEMATGGGGPYRVFTPFWRKASLVPLRDSLAAPHTITLPAKMPKPVSIDSLKLLPTIAWDAGLNEAWTPGEAGAWKHVRHFLSHDERPHGIGIYLDRRNEPAVDANSRLSPHLHFGEVGPVQLFARTRRLSSEHESAGLARNVEGFVRQLGWREFSHHLLYHFPETPERPVNPAFLEFPWRKPGDYRNDLKAWQQGRTGIPIVDAGMRQLWATGVMHNRLRLIVASFLTKNLLIPWDEGARWFWDTLVDADLGNNTLGWQWVAGCGADAAPYYRIFNPVLQSAKFDGRGQYLRHWVPELAKLPDASLHAPWDAKPEVLRRVKFEASRDYVDPIVELGASREAALAAYGQTKRG